MHYTVNCIHSSDNSTCGKCSVRRNWLGGFKECNYHPIYNDCKKRVEYPRPELQPQAHTQASGMFSASSPKEDSFINYREAVLHVLEVLNRINTLQKEQIEIELRLHNVQTLETVNVTLKDYKRLIDIKLEYDLLQEILEKAMKQFRKYEMLTNIEEKEGRNK